MTYAFHRNKNWKQQLFTKYLFLDVFCFCLKRKSSEFWSSLYINIVRKITCSLQTSADSNWGFGFPLTQRAACSLAGASSSGWLPTCTIGYFLQAAQLGFWTCVDYWVLASLFEKPELSVLLRQTVVWALECRITCWLALVEGQDLIAISGKCFCLWL